MIFLEGGKEVEVMLKVMVEMEEVTVVGGKGLPRAGIFPGIFFCGPFPTVPSPLQIFSFLSFLLMLVMLVSLLLSESLVPLCFWLLELMLVLLMILMLLVVEPWFVFEGMKLDFFSLFGGSPPLPGHLGPALLIICFGLDLTRVLGLRCLADGGGSC